MKVLGFPATNINPIPIYTIVKASNGLATLIDTDEKNHQTNNRAIFCGYSILPPLYSSLLVNILTIYFLNSVKFDLIHLSTGSQS